MSIFTRESGRRALAAAAGPSTRNRFHPNAFSRRFPRRRSGILPVMALMALLLSGAGKAARAAGEAGLPALRVPNALGVNIHFTEAPGSEMSQLAAGGFRFVRMDYDWNRIEPTPGHYDFSTYERFVRLIRQYGIRPLLILDYSNKNYDSGLSPHDEAGWNAYARFAAASVAHFRGDGVLWEIWNEPNGFWIPRRDADAYANMAVRAAAAMRKADHDATILAPASSGIDLGFIETSFKHGLLENITAVSVHPYRGGDPETVTGDYARLRSLIQQYSPGHRPFPIVSSEWGYSSSNVTDLQQGQFLARQWLTNLADGIRLSIWYDWHNDGPDPKNAEHNFGTVTTSFQPKVSYLAARTLTHTLDGYQPVRSIALQPGDYGVLFRKGNELRLAAWTTAAPHKISWPSPSPTNAVSMTGDTSTLSSDRGWLAIPLSGSPQYLNVTNSPLARFQASLSLSPEAVVAPSGVATPVKVTFHNTFSQPIRGQITLRAPGAPASGAAIPVDVAPGKTTTLTLEGIRRTDRSPQPQEWRLNFRGDGIDVDEPIQVSVSDPFAIDIAPIGGGAGLEIENPAGPTPSSRLAARSPAPTCPCR
ncbi:MAG: cellulase family glycosylhydrolase [Chloroflexi bacterium]|nr:cellulase family glycosylhydrolase [Chloroflexota bacterium]